MFYIKFPGTGKFETQSEIPWSRTYFKHFDVYTAAVYNEIGRLHRVIIVVTLVTHSITRKTTKLKIIIKYRTLK